jgi:hypothetical protein
MGSSRQEADNQLSAISNQPSATSFQPSAISRQPPGSRGAPWSAESRWLTAYSYRLSAARIGDAPLFAES